MGTLEAVKRWRTFVLLVIAVALITLIYVFRQDLGLAGPSGVPTDTAGMNSGGPRPARIIWQKVDRSSDGFKLEMPTDSKDIQIPAYNERGGAEQVNMLYSFPDAQTSYSIAWADDPPVARINRGAPERILDMARDDALARTQSTLVSESRSQRQGMPARDFAGRNEGGGIFNARLILDGSRLYMLIASFPSESARRTQDVQRFFNSFIIVPTAAR